jgi:CO/xanthine dehydrogenase Mo-binding subunit
VVAVMTQQDLSEDQALVVQEEVHATRRVLNLFAKDKVIYHGQKIASIAAASREMAEDAVRLVEVENYKISKS